MANQWRGVLREYADRLDISDATPIITLGEGGTPLLPADALSARTGARLDTLMSAEVLHHLVQLPYRHFERTPSGVIVERLRQLDVLRSFFTGQMPVLAIDIAFVVLFLAATFAISATLGMVATAAIPILVGVSLASHRAQRRLADESFQALAAKSSTLTETVANAATIVTTGQQLGIPIRGWIIAVATAMQESTLHNYGNLGARGEERRAEPL